MATEEKEYSLDDWQESWNTDEVPWHMTEPDGLLVRNKDSLTGGRSNLKIYVPLCGMSADIKWLADEGHTVIGTEISDKAIKFFFEEHKLQYTVTPKPNVEGKVYASADGKIRLYACDFFKFTKEIEGKFDAVWDTSAFMAIGDDDKERYMELMLTLMKDECKYLLEAPDYSKEAKEQDGNVHEEDFRKMIGTRCDVKLLENVGHEWFHEDGCGDPKDCEHCIANTFRMKVYLLTLAK